MKKFLSVVLCLTLAFIMVIPASASIGNERIMEYDHINTITANISVNRFWGVVSCDGSITASNDYPVYVEVYLQQKTDNGWTTLESWTNSGQYQTEAGGSYAVAKGYQYRTYTAGYVYDDNGTIIDSGYAIYGITYE